MRKTEKRKKNGKKTEKKRNFFRQKRIYTNFLDHFFMTGLEFTGLKVYYREVRFKNSVSGERDTIFFK